MIAVVSGKGGVGKSMVTASLARLMREQGFSVGIMDADNHRSIHSEDVWNP